MQLKLKSNLVLMSVLVENQILGSRLSFT